MARCLNDLGLRYSEVARLSLDDFDWLQGTIIIKQTKSHSERSLPLHAITGKAIEAYLLHSRPATQGIHDGIWQEGWRQSEGSYGTDATKRDVWEMSRADNPIHLY
ncbi:tyrosine-type recombinase/integrase [Halobacillus seohaensis]|uniref:Tyrosine-type recombinase/integrase n=1 Tax=Halobacillus seohaensis TaxID=447421 RepID=A0ABW2EMC0_9BACI